MAQKNKRTILEIEKNDKINKEKYILMVKDVQA
jgi:hypothetical protein